MAKIAVDSYNIATLDDLHECASSQGSVLNSPVTKYAERVSRAWPWICCLPPGPLPEGLADASPCDPHAIEVDVGRPCRVSVPRTPPPTALMTSRYLSTLRLLSPYLPYQLLAIQRVRSFLKVIMLSATQKECLRITLTFYICINLERLNLTVLRLIYPNLYFVGSNIQLRRHRRVIALE